MSDLDLDFESGFYPPGGPRHCPLGAAVGGAKMAALRAHSEALGLPAPVFGYNVSLNDRTFYTVDAALQFYDAAGSPARIGSGICSRPTNESASGARDLLAERLSTEALERILRQCPCRALLRP